MIQRFLPLMLLFLSISCSTNSLSPTLYHKKLLVQTKKNIEKHKADFHIKKLEVLLDQGIELNKTKNIGKTHFIMLKAISRYQLYYFISPSQARLNKLKKYYQFFKHHYKETYKKEFLSFFELKKLIMDVLLRSKIAQKRKEKLKTYLKDQEIQRKLREKMDYDYEIGGVILDKKGKIEMHFIKDTKRQILKKYIHEFTRNDFRHLDILEKIFLKRFSLKEIHSDSSTKSYTKIVGALLRKKFSTIRNLSKKKRLTQEEIARLENAKKKIFFFGLKKSLLKRTYYMDVTPYLYKNTTAFFFHTHPYIAPGNYQKKPSGQDQQMTYRTGPSIVFDVQKHFIDVYSTILGKIEKIIRINE